MNRFLHLFFLLTVITGFSQKTYQFDHLLEYEYRLHQDSLPQQRLLLTSAAENSYNALIAPADDEQVRIDFTDQDGLQFLTKLERADLLQAKTVKIPCSFVFPYENRYKKRTRDHAFFSPEDTLIDGEKLQRYEFRYINERFLERKKFVKMYFVLDNNSSYHKPTFVHPTAYEEWKKEKSLPNGIFKTRYQLNHKKDTVGIYELKAVHEINLSFVVEKGCDPRS